MLVLCDMYVQYRPYERATRYSPIEICLLMFYTLYFLYTVNSDLKAKARYFP